MPLLKGDAIIPDPWEHAGDEDHLAAGKNFSLCLDRLKRDQEFLPEETPLGVRLAPGAKAEDVAPFLDRLDLVSIEFPKFKDGRGFTLARVLRERYGFEGEIRATGHILPDQYALLLRCGFSTVEIPETADIDVWLAALARYRLAYQPGLTEERPLNLFRRGVQEEFAVVENEQRKNFLI